MSNNPIVQLYEENHEAWTAKILKMREIVLSNLVMVSQIPSKTFQEKERARFVLDRFMDSRLLEPASDEMGNVIATIKGKNQKRRILISAHMDTLFGPEVDHNVTISSGKAYGAGIADNALGVAALISFPELLQSLDFSFNSDIVLLTTVQSKERGDLKGFRHFMKHTKDPIDFNLNIEGITLGQVDHSTLSRVRCDITCNLDSAASSAWSHLGHTSAIMILNDVIDSLYSIPLPRRPKTIMNIGKVTGGSSYSRVCTDSSLHLEVRSEDDSVTDQLIQDIQDNCIDIGARYGVELGLDFFSRQHAAGIRYSHPLVKGATSIVKSLGHKPIMGPSNSEIAVPLSKKIPSLTLGLSTGSESGSPDKHYVDINPITQGLLQVLLILKAIDLGYCDDDIK